MILQGGRAIIRAGRKKQQEEEEDEEEEVIKFFNPPVGQNLFRQLGARLEQEGLLICSFVIDIQTQSEVTLDIRHHLTKAVTEALKGSGQLVAIEYDDITGKLRRHKFDIDADKFTITLKPNCLVCLGHGAKPFSLWVLQCLYIASWIVIIPGILHYYGYISFPSCPNPLHAFHCIIRTYREPRNNCQEDKGDGLRDDSCRGHTIQVFACIEKHAGLETFAGTEELKREHVYKYGYLQATEDIHFSIRIEKNSRHKLSVPNTAYHAWIDINDLVSMGFHRLGSKWEGMIERCEKPGSKVYMSCIRCSFMCKCHEEKKEANDSPCRAAHCSQKKALFDPGRGESLRVPPNFRCAKDEERASELKEEQKRQGGGRRRRRRDNQCSHQQPKR